MAQSMILTNLYKSLVDMVEAHMADVAMCKTDIGDFEVRPAIGFGIPMISPVGIIGRDDEVQLTIPVVIETYGAAEPQTVQLAALYEELRTTLKTYLQTHLTSNNVTLTSLDIDTFQPLPIGSDIAVRGLGGNLVILIKL